MFFKLLVRTVWKHHWVQIAEPPSCQAPLESVCGAPHIFQVGSEYLGFFLTQFWTVGATCTRGEKVVEENIVDPFCSCNHNDHSFSSLSLRLSSVGGGVYNTGAHACHCTHRGQRTASGIRPRLPLCLRQGLRFTAVYTRLDPLSARPRPYRHACVTGSTLPRFKWVLRTRTQVLMLVWHPPSFLFWDTASLYSASCPEAPNPPPSPSWELGS